MTWQEIYNKYKDSELMKEFENFLMTHDFFRVQWNKKVHVKTILIKENIKDIWGYLICFAETKEWIVSIEYQYGIFEDDDNEGSESYWIGKVAQEYPCRKKSLEQAMLWCADKFFELNKEVKL